MAGISVSVGWDATKKSRNGLVDNGELTPRGIKALIAVSVGVALAAALGVFPGGFGSTTEVTGSAGESSAYRVVSVRPGDSLWAIAERSMPGQDPEVAIRQLRNLNGPGALNLHPGQSVLIP